MIPKVPQLSLFAFLKVWRGRLRQAGVHLESLLPPSGGLRDILLSSDRNSLKKNIKIADKVIVLY